MTPLQHSCLNQLKRHGDADCASTSLLGVRIDGPSRSPESPLEELVRLEAQEKLLASEVRDLHKEVDEIATAAMKAEIDVQRSEAYVSREEERSYNEAVDTLDMLSQGNEHGWDNIRSWIGWETAHWFPNYY